MNAVLWIIALMLLGLGVMVLEVFLPSGGILGILSALALVAAIATAFLEQGVVTGIIAAGVVVLAVPAVLALAFRWFPETPLGRRVLPPLPEAEELLPGTDRRRQARALIGRTGRTASELLPWGRVDVDGGQFDAISEAGPLDVGTAVEVVASQGSAVVVRPVDRPPTRPAKPAPPDQPDPAAGSALSPTLETFEFDGLNPPA